MDRKGFLVAIIAGAAFFMSCLAAPVFDTGGRYDEFMFNMGKVSFFKRISDGTYWGLIPWKDHVGWLPGNDHDGSKPLITKFCVWDVHPDPSGESGFMFSWGADSVWIDVYQTMAQTGMYYLGSQCEALNGNCYLPFNE